MISDTVQVSLKSALTRVAHQLRYNLSYGIIFFNLFAYISYVINGDDLNYLSLIDFIIHFINEKQVSDMENDFVPFPFFFSSPCDLYPYLPPFTLHLLLFASSSTEFKGIYEKKYNMLF